MFASALKLRSLIACSTGARYVLNQSHLIRRDPFSKTEEHIAHDGLEDESQYPRPQAPVRYAHVDQSYVGAEFLTRCIVEHTATYDPEVYKALKESPRYQLLTIWRPIRPVKRDPLAVVDARTIADDDLVGVPIKVRDGFVIEMAHLKAQSSAKHQWYYVHDMQPDEVLVFKTYDSWQTRPDGSPIARSVPHASFIDPEFEGKGLPIRESIEYRAMVFY